MKKVTIVMNWLGYERLRFAQTLNHTEQQRCRISAGLFEVLCEKFKPQHN